MDFGQLIWQILALLALGGLVVVIILAIIEPGPLQDQRGFGSSRRKKREEAELVEEAASNEPDTEG